MTVVSDNHTRRATHQAGPAPPPPERSAAGGHGNYGSFRAELIAFVRTRFGAGPPEPEDVVQQAFANFAALGPETKVLNARAFLFRTARNIAVNDHRRQRVGQKFLAADPQPQEVCEGREDLNPEVVVLGREAYRLIERTIREMPEKRRTILLLHRLEGLSYADIARRLRVSESLVRKHVSIAIRECSAVLGSAHQVGPADREIE